MHAPEDRPCPPTDASSPGHQLRPMQGDTATPAPVAFPETIAPAGGTLADSERLAQTIAGYEILEELGRGGMGVVYKARQTSLKRVVALKRIRAGTDAGPQDLARFRAEAESVARLQHPNIVQIYEVGEHQGLPFFSLEYVEGGSLDRRLAGTAQPAHVAARLVEAIARGVHDAHQHGLVHRDLKPANVLLAGGPEVPLEVSVPKVSDFGLVKRLDDDSAQTQSGAVIGTPAYMAPEQAGGHNRDVGPHTDVYALGVILYECLTGRPPFQAASPLETLAQVIHDEPVPPRKRNRKVPRDLETICLKCLHKAPARRYGSARELADDLRRFLSFEPIRARRVGVAERGWRWLRRRPAACLAALLLVLLLAGAGIGYRLWQQARQSAGHESGSPGLVVEYYDSVLRPDDEPRGVGRLSEAEALRRPRAFKLHRRGDQVAQVDVLGRQGRLLRHNPFHLLARGGVPTTNPLQEASYHFVHDEEGRVSEVEAHDGAGHVLWSVQRLAPGRVWYTERPGPWGEPSAEAALFELVRDGAGEVREIRHVAKGRPSVARRKVQRLRREVGAAGEVRLTFLGSSGQPVGAAPRWVLRTRDTASRLEEAYFDAAGKPVAGAEGCPRWLWSQEGPHALRSAGLDAEGRPMRARDGSYSSLRRFDEQGREVEQAWFGMDGTPLVADSGSAKVTSRYDSRGALLEKSSWILDKRGHFLLRRRADAADRTLELASFTPEGWPTLHKEGYHRFTARYDERGNRVEAAGFGLDGKPCLNKDGFHRYIAHYDERRRKVEEAYFGLDGKPCLHRFGNHRWTHRYDERGHLVEVAYFRPDGKPAARVDEGILKGCARLTWEYDDKGELRQRCYFVPDGKGGCALYRRTDAANSTLEQAYFAPTGQPILHKEGYHRWTARYNQRHKRVEESYFGLDGRPTARVDEVPFKGCARLTWEYDDKGELRQRCYFVADGKGGCVLRRRADAADRTLELAFFTPEGRPTLHKDGNHRFTARFDKRGNQVERAFFGLDGKPCLIKNGYHRFTNRYDKFGHRVEWACFGLDGKPCRNKDGTHRWAVRYDERGNKLEEAYFGVDGRPAVCAQGASKGYARLTWEYDGTGKLRQRCYFVADDKGGCGLCRRTDAADRTLELASFTPEGRPTLSKDGIHRVTFRYEERGKPVEIAFFGLDGKPCLHKNGYHRFTARYDQGGNRVEGAYFGPDGKPCLQKNGYHRWTDRYDERGKLVEEAYFGLNGRPTANIGEGSLKGCTKLTWEYDAKGKLCQRGYFVLDGKGGCVLRRRADAADRTLELAFFTPEGRPTLHKDGNHRFTARYDERGRLVEAAYFGLDGKSCLHKDGYHRATKRYDERGRLAATAVFDVAGKRLHCRILVGKVSPGSLAAKAGLREGDVLLRYAGKELTSAALFWSFRGDEGASGPPRKLELLREGKPLTAELPPGEPGMTLLNKVSPPGARP